MVSNYDDLKTNLTKICKDNPPNVGFECVGENDWNYLKFLSEKGYLYHFGNLS